MAVAFVSGAARGIGRAIALQLARQGNHIVINDLPTQKELCESLAVEVAGLGQRSIICHADAGSPEELEGVFGSIQSTFGRLDIAVANAAHSIRKPFLEQTVADVKRQIDVVQIGSFLVAQHAAKMMIDRIRQEGVAATARETNGKIVFISSIMGQHVLLRNAVPYAMSKAAVCHMGRYIARELCDYRINVNVVTPGLTNTPGERQFGMTDEWAARAGPVMPWARIGLPEDIAHCVGFLCGPHSHHITGAAIPVDGGYSVNLKLPLPDS